MGSHIASRFAYKRGISPVDKDTHFKSLETTGCLGLSLADSSSRAERLRRRRGYEEEDAVTAKKVRLVEERAFQSYVESVPQRGLRVALEERLEDERCQEQIEKEAAAQKEAEKRAEYLKRAEAVRKLRRRRFTGRVSSQVRVSGMVIGAVVRYKFADFADGATFSLEDVDRMSDAFKDAVVRHHASAHIQIADKKRFAWLKAEH